ncbi:MAG: hypothetical protein RLY14_2276 [Planctomycetota bacterium]|jgi:cytochrome c peroxidase
MKSSVVFSVLFVILILDFASSASAQRQTTTPPPPPPPLQSLRQVPVPRPSNLSSFVANEIAAIRLGKALFWDMQLGTDNTTACASCHFHAGADNRSKNQISPGLLRVDAQGNPAPDTSFQVGGPNYTLKPTDFPFHKLKDINNASSTVLSDRNDIASSQGVFFRQYLGLDAAKNEVSLPIYDEVFHVGNINTRRVEPRNTPSAINAVFNLRNFWDGRAQDIFNGVNPFGLRDSQAGVFYADRPSQVRKVAVAIDNSSLASQASGPPLSAFEMSSAGNVFPELGRRILSKRPLALQLVHPEDSVLGALSRGQAPGLSVTDYAQLVREAFKPEWWQGTSNVEIDYISGTSFGTAHADSSESLAKATQGPKTGATKVTYTQMEANFSLFFGLSVQLYESLLVSDQTPFDRYAEGNTSALTLQQIQGLDLFFNKGKCATCHRGAEFTGASVQSAKMSRIERMIMGNGQSGVYDGGFYNIAVRPTLEDLGVGGLDPFGFPLSEARVLSLFGPTMYQGLVGVPPNLSLTSGERVVADGAFKTPGLRNVELTAPYFHNGGQRTLLEVVDFYNRGGDFAAQNASNLDADITKLGLTAKEKDAIVAFLKALTDERVRYRRAPFDHPQLLIPNGHVGDTFTVLDYGNGEAVDSMLELPATGRNGGTPLRNFLE